VEALMLTDLRLWRWQRTTALAVLPLVVAHVVLQYWVFGGEAAFDAVSARVKGGAILALDLVLLAAVSAHAFLGLRSMLQDYARTSGSAAWITRATLFMFVATFLYGLAALCAFL
jgi:succinate dehydrogenase hydrophobic membrane anchor protein